MYRYPERWLVDDTIASEQRAKGPGSPAHRVQAVAEQGSGWQGGTYNCSGGTSG